MYMSPMSVDEQEGQLTIVSLETLQGRIEAFNEMLARKTLLVGALAVTNTEEDLSRRT